MIPAFEKVAVLDTFLNRCMSLHDTEDEAVASMPRDARSHCAFSVVPVLVTVEVRPATRAPIGQQKFF